MLSEAASGFLRFERVLQAQANMESDPTQLVQVKHDSFTWKPHVTGLAFPVSSGFPLCISRLVGLVCVCGTRGNHPEVLVFQGVSSVPALHMSKIVNNERGGVPSGKTHLH